MDDGKLSLNALNDLQRAKDIKRVHDSSRKNKKEKRQTEDGMEFVDFLEDNEKVIDGFTEFAPEEPIVQAPSDKMLDLLGTAMGPPIQIEPIEEAAPRKSGENNAADAAQRDEE